MPYRTVDNRIDGVVITFVDVTDRKLAERAAVEAREYAENIVATLHELGRRRQAHCECAMANRPVHISQLERR